MYEEDEYEPGEGWSAEDQDNYTFRDEAGYGFSDPGGKSALRAASKNNPRNLPCPTCHHPNRLTPRDVQLGYQCDRCADAAEGGWDIDYYEENDPYLYGPEPTQNHEYAPTDPCCPLPELDYIHTEWRSE